MRERVDTNGRAACSNCLKRGIKGNLVRHAKLNSGRKSKVRNWKMEFPKNYRFPGRAEQRSLVLCLVYEVNFLLAHIAILAFEVDNCFA